MARHATRIAYLMITLFRYLQPHFPIKQKTAFEFLSYPFQPYTRTPEIQVNAVRSITRTTNQRPYKWTAVAGFTVNTDDLGLAGRQSYLEHAFCA